MNNKKILSTTMIVIGIIASCIFIFMIFNNVLSKCPKDNLFDKNTNTCYYYSQSCKIAEQSKLIEGNNVCYYEKKQLIDNELFKSIFWIIGIIFLILLVLFLFFANKNEQQTLDVDAAMDATCDWFSLRYDLPMYNGKHIKTNFKKYPQRFKTRKNGDLYAKTQIFVLDGDFSGVYTCEINLNGTIRDILNGNVDMDRFTLHSYKRPKDYPIPNEMQERVLERIEEENPEKAAKLREEMLSNQLTKATNQQFSQANTEFMSQIMPQPIGYQPYRKPQPKYRRSWLRRF